MNTTIDDDRTIREKILRMLLKSSPKTAKEIAIELGYCEKIKGNIRTKYNCIMPYLNMLRAEGFFPKIESFKKGRGRPLGPTKTYEIVYNRNNIERLLKEFPSFLPELQKNYNVILMLIEDNKWIIDIYPEIKEELICLHLLISAKKSLSLDCKVIKPPIKNGLMDKIMTSRTLFKQFINNPPDELKNKFYQVYCSSKKPSLDSLYKTYVFYELLNGKKCDEAEQYIKEMDSHTYKSDIDVICPDTIDVVCHDAIDASKFYLFQCKAGHEPFQ